MYRYMYVYMYICICMYVALKNVTKDNEVPMMGHHFCHQSGQDESSGQSPTSF